MPFIAALVAANVNAPVGRSLTQSQPARPDSAPELAEIVAVLHYSTEPYGSRVAVLLTDGQCDIVALVPRRVFLRKFERVTDAQKVPMQRLVKVSYDGLEWLASEDLTLTFRMYIKEQPVLSVTSIEYLGPGGILPSVNREPWPKINPFMHRERTTTTTTKAACIRVERLHVHRPSYKGTIKFPVPTEARPPKPAERVPPMLPDIGVPRGIDISASEKSIVLQEARSSGFFASLKRRLGVSDEPRKKIKKS